jgi:phospholipase C
MSPAMDEIRHIVVLMLENRSFDHLLGFLKPAFAGQGFEGLDGRESIPLDPRVGPGNAVSVVQVSTDDICVTAADPGHELPDVLLQLYGKDTVPAGAVPLNDGFVCSYSGQKDRHGQPYGEAVGRTIMGCPDPLQIVPVLSTLAQNFVVCDHWFASVPGPTWPNRFFAHAATCAGHDESPTNAEAIKSQLWNSPFQMRTIYENLMAAPQPQTWKIYFHDVPQSFALRSLHRHADCFEYFYRREDRATSFFDDVANGTLPSYSFIEPQYFNAPLAPANDQHPPHDLRYGEALVADVYDALLSNADVWSRCLFVLLYDEHGGFFDHVPPPATVNPDGINSPTSGFDFTRLGVRVPALLVSPWVPKGRVDHTIYDHSSLLASVKKIFGLPDFLTRRDAMANTFEHNFLDQSRAAADVPPSLHDKVRAVPAHVDATADLRLSAYQVSLDALSVALTPSTNEHAASARVKGRLDRFLDQPQTP